MKSAAETKGEKEKTSQSPPAFDPETIFPIQSDYGAAAGLPLFMKLPGRFAGAGIRAKSEVSQPNDPDEQEADTMADRVMRMQNSSSPGECGACAGEDPTCDRCRDRTPNRILRSANAPGQQAISETPLMSRLGPGSPLDASVRAFFEPRFGREFSNVRVHTGAGAAESARAVRARAYALGQDVVFGAGQYSAESPEGRKLLAHELAHTLQPSSDRVRRDIPPGPDSPGRETSGEDLISQAIRSRAPDDVKKITDFTSASETQKFELINILLTQGWVGPYDEWALEAIWGSFGTNLISLASDHLELWNLCIEAGAELDDLPAIVGLKTKFVSDIKTIVGGYLQENAILVLNEMDRLGLPTEENAAQPEPTAEQTDEVVHMQRAAAAVAKLQKAQEEARGVYVGYRSQTESHPMAQSAVLITVPVKFDPYVPPPSTNPPTLFTPGVEVEIKPYQEIKAKYDQASRMIEQYLTLYPSLYAISREAKSSSTAAFAGISSPAQALRQLGAEMRKLFSDIIATKVKLDMGDLDPLDLTPIHEQLVGGMPAPSSIDWQLGLPKAIAADLVKDHKFSEALAKLGLDAAAMALFLLAPFTGGASIFVMLAGLGVTGVKLYLSTEQYQNLAQAGRSSPVPGTELVTEHQVDEAQMAMQADQIAFALAAIAVGTVVATRIIGAIRGPAAGITGPPAPGRLGTSGSAVMEALEGGQVGVRLTSAEGTVTGQILSRSPVAGGELVKVSVAEGGAQADILLSRQGAQANWRVLTAEEAAAWNRGETMGTALEPRALLPGGQQAAPTTYSSGFHGTSEIAPAEALQNGFPGRGSNWNLLEHVEQRGASAFRGTTQLVADPVVEGGAAYWAGEGGWVYEVRNVPVWDVNALLEGRVRTPGGFRGNLMVGEGEMTTISRIPPERIYRYGQVVSNPRGKLYVQEWIYNPRYRPPGGGSSGTTGGQQ